METDAIAQLEWGVEAPAEAHVGDLIDLRLVVTNRGDSTVEVLAGLPGERAQFRVRDQQGSEVWQYLTTIASIAQSWNIAPHADVSFDGHWKGVDKEWNAVPPGEYSITGQIVTRSSASLVSGESPPVKITILPAE